MTVVDLEFLEQNKRMIYTKLDIGRGITIGVICMYLNKTEEQSQYIVDNLPEIYQVSENKWRYIPECEFSMLTDEYKKEILTFYQENRMLENKMLETKWYKHLLACSL